MNDDDSLLERELTRLVPRPPSAELKARLSDQLSALPVRRHPMFRTAVGIAAALALVVLAMVALSRRPIGPNEKVLKQESPSSAIAALDDSVPSVWNYRRAVIEPAVELDDLLDRHSRTIGPSPSASPEPFSVSSLHQQSRMGAL